jgi:hypothetical protein
VHQSRKLSKATSIREQQPNDEINLPGICSQDGFLLALPPTVHVVTKDMQYRAEVAGVLENEERVYNLITTIENYHFDIQYYMDSDVSKLASEITVLIIYFDSELHYYCTLAVGINLIRIEGKDVDRSATTDSEERYRSPYITLDLSNQVILKFDDWKKQNFDIDSY